MSAKFNPIRIINLVSEKTEQSPTASGLRLMYLQLSATPSEEWIQLFDQQRRIPTGRNMVGGRQATVEGKYIVLDCVPDELEKQHEYLKHDIKVANEEYQAFCNRVEAQAAQEDQTRKSEIEKIELIKSRLKFD